MSLEVSEKSKKEERIRASIFLRYHVENRLRMNIPYMSHWPQAMALMSLPQNAPKSLHYGLEMVDSMWHHAGKFEKLFNLCWGFYVKYSQHRHKNKTL